MFIIVALICMTEFVPSKEDQYVIGFFFIAIIVLNLGMHLYFLLKDVFLGLLMKCKEKLSKKKEITPQDINPFE